MRMELTVHVELDEDNKVEAEDVVRMLVIDALEYGRAYQGTKYEADCMERLRGCADRLAQLVEKVEEE